MRLIAHQAHLGFFNSCRPHGKITSILTCQKMLTRKLRLVCAMCTSVTKHPAERGNFGKSRLALTYMEVGIEYIITVWFAITR